MPQVAVCGRSVLSLASMQKSPTGVAYVVVVPPLRTRGEPGRGTLADVESLLEDPGGNLAVETTEAFSLPSRKWLEGFPASVHKKRYKADKGAKPRGGGSL